MLVTYVRTIVSTAGHVSCVFVLFGTNLLIGAIDGTARSLVKVIATCTDNVALRLWHNYLAAALH